MTNPSHNHPGSPPSTFTAHRQREIRRNRLQITGLFDQKIPNRYILDTCRLSEGSCLTPRDIENVKQRWKQEKLKNREGPVTGMDTDRD